MCTFRSFANRGETCLTTVVVEIARPSRVAFLYGCLAKRTPLDTTSWVSGAGCVMLDVLNSWQRALFQFLSSSVWLTAAHPAW